MPQADLLYSANLDLDVPAILAAVERTILEHDAGAGACKGRGYKTQMFHHTHVTLRVALLDKPHRDDAFMSVLRAAIEEEVKALIAQPCAFAIELSFSSRYYATSIHAGADI